MGTLPVSLFLLRKWQNIFSIFVLRDWDVPNNPDKLHENKETPELQPVQYLVAVPCPYSTLPYIQYNDMDFSQKAIFCSFLLFDNWHLLPLGCHQWMACYICISKCLSRTCVQNQKYTRRPLFYSCKRKFILVHFWEMSSSRMLSGALGSLHCCISCSPWYTLERTISV